MNVIIKIFKFDFMKYNVPCAKGMLSFFNNSPIRPFAGK